MSDKPEVHYWSASDGISWLIMSLGKGARWSCSTGCFPTL